MGGLGDLLVVEVRPGAVVAFQTAGFASAPSQYCRQKHRLKMTESDGDTTYMNWLLATIQGILIGVASGLVLSVFHAWRTKQHRKRQIKGLRDTCIFWLRQLQEGQASALHVADQLVSSCDRYLPFLGAHLTVDEGSELVLGLNYLRREYHNRRLIETAIDSADVREVLGEFARTVRFLDLRQTVEKATAGHPTW